MVKIEMKKSLRRKKQRIHTKKITEHQLKTQHDLLSQATTDEDKAAIKEKIRSLTRLWERQQEIWRSEDRVSTKWPR
jgi:hypothetical protein